MQWFICFDIKQFQCDVVVVIVQVDYIKQFVVEGSIVVSCWNFVLQFCFVVVGLCFNQQKIIVRRGEVDEYWIFVKDEFFNKVIVGIGDLDGFFWCDIYEIEGKQDVVGGKVFYVIE